MSSTPARPPSGFSAPHQAERRRRARLGALISLPALVALALALWFFSVRGSGVDMSAGAGLAILGALATLVGPMIAARLRRGHWPRRLIVALTILAAVLSAIAGYFLMQYPYAALMALAALAAIIIPCIPAPEPSA